MKIKLITRMAGPDGSFPPGFVFEMAEKAALELVNGGYAVCQDEAKADKPKRAVKK